MARDQAGGLVGERPLVRFLLLTDLTHNRIPATPTPSWVILSTDIHQPIVVPYGVDPNTIPPASAEYTWIILDANGIMYINTAIRYPEGLSPPPLPEGSRSTSAVFVSRQLA